MKKAADELSTVLDYAKFSKARSTKPPKLTKEEVPSWITCPNYTKAMGTLERTMERFNSKVGELEQRLKESHNHIESLRKQQKKIDPGYGFFVNTKDAQEVARYNDRLNQTRRLGERINDAVHKHNDIVERHQDAVREAKEKLEELKEQALMAIDDDIVAALDRCAKIRPSPLPSLTMQCSLL